MKGYSNSMKYKELRRELQHELDGAVRGFDETITQTNMMEFLSDVLHVFFPQRYRKLIDWVDTRCGVTKNFMVTDLGFINTPDKVPDVIIQDVKSYDLSTHKYTKLPLAIIEMKAIDCKLQDNALNFYTQYLLNGNLYSGRTKYLILTNGVCWELYNQSYSTPKPYYHRCLDVQGRQIINKNNGEQVDINTKEFKLLVDEIVKIYKEILHSISS